MRLSEIAEILAPHELMTAEAMQNILRGPGILSLLTSQPGRGRTSPAEFLPEEVARARLLLAARECGLSGSDLGKINETLNAPPAPALPHAPSARIEGGIHHPSGLLSIVRGTKAGEDWKIQVRVLMTYEGHRKVTAEVFWSGADMSESGASTLLGRITIPASDLIRPLLDNLEG